MTNWVEIKNEALRWTYEAGDLIREAIKRPIVIETKSNANDLVTEVDRKIEAFFYEKMKATYPDHFFLGEEGMYDEKPSGEGTVWIIDPIDGTMNFVHQKQKFAISVAVYHNGVGMIGIVYDVMSDEMFYAVKGEGAYVNEKKLEQVSDRSLSEALISINGAWLVKEESPYQKELISLVRDVRGMRSYGSAAIEMAYVASNRIDCYLSVKLSPWDYAAGAVLLEEVGYPVTTFSGEKLTIDRKSSVICGKPSIHNKVIERYVGKASQK